MRDLAVDLTPTCVNKTAIHHIALDTLQALATCCQTDIQYRGTRTKQRADRGQEIAIAEAFHSDLERWARYPGGVAPNVHGDKTQRLYFDPIYTLYQSLEPHDVVFVLDTSPLTDPEWHSPRVSSAYEKAFAHVAQSRAKIACISAHCAEALRSAFAIPSTDIAMVPLYLRVFQAGPGNGRGAPSSSLKENKFLLFVGSLETRKNLIGLMRAFALSGLADAGWRLAFAGGRGHGATAILGAAEECSSVDMLGFVTDDELEWLYRNAAFFAYPSFLEGFGLPLLEAMSHGLPCLASTTGASAEICGDLAILVDPYDVPAIAEGLRTCVESAGTAPPEQLKTRAHQFTFERYFAALRQVIEQAAT